MIWPFKRKSAPQSASPILSDNSRFGGGWFNIMEANTGDWQRGIVHMDHYSATHNSAVWACINRIAGDFARLPLRVEQKKRGSNVWQEAATQLPAVLRMNPNLTPYEFKERLMIQLLRHGNAYLFMTRGRSGEVKQIDILNAEKVQVLVAPSGETYYRVGQDNESGITAEKAADYSSVDVCHIRINTLYSHYVGVSPLVAACHSGALGVNAKEMAVSMMANAANPRTVITLEGTPTAEKMATFSQAWERGHGGRNNGKTAVIGDGAKFQVISTPLFDESILSAIKLSTDEIYRIFGLNAAMMDGSASTGSNTAQLMQNYLSGVLAKYLTVIEQRLESAFYLELGQRPDLRLNFDTSELLRLDPVTAMDIAVKGVAGGVYTVNEARAMQNCSPVDGGDTVYLQQQNYSLAALNARDNGLINPDMTPANDPELAPAAANDPEPPKQDEGQKFARYKQLAFASYDAEHNHIVKNRVKLACERIELPDARTVKARLNMYGGFIDQYMDDKGNPHIVYYKPKGIVKCGNMFLRERTPDKPKAPKGKNRVPVNYR